VDSEDILSRTPPAADARLRYGDDPNQFGDLRLPPGKGGHPTVMFIHGGFWRARYDLLHAGHLCAALSKLGWATWNVEYRRVGNTGGGWPDSFEDLLAAERFLGQVARRYSLDVSHTVVMGHSAGGQLALCLAARLKSTRHAVSLAGVVDLKQAFELHLSHDAVAEFLGGSPATVPEHYREADPMELRINGVEQWLVHGDADDIVPPQFSARYVAAKARAGEKAELLALKGAGHFDVIDPGSAAWPRVRGLLEKLRQPYSQEFNIRS
jgi:acetyl esterase/lipase